MTLGLALAASFCPALAHAGAWTEQAGDGRVILTLRGATADDYFDSSSDTADGPTFRSEAAEEYATYGLTDSTTLVLQSSYSHLHPDAPAQGASGFDETKLGLQQRLWHDDDQVVSVQASALLPGDSRLTSGGADLELRGLFGQSFVLLGRNAFVDTQLAYRWRANGFADQFRADLTLGVWMDRNLLLMAQNFNTFTTTSGNAQYFEGEQQKLQLSSVYRFNEQVAVQLGGFATLSGRNTPVERGALASIWFDY
jgi:hypothetical protein